LASIGQEVQYDGGRSREKVQEHSLKLWPMAAKGKEGPVGFWKKNFPEEILSIFMFQLLH